MKPRWTLEAYGRERAPYRAFAKAWTRKELHKALKKLQRAGYTMVFVRSER